MGKVTGFMEFQRLQEAAPVHVAGVRKYFVDPIGVERMCAVSAQLRGVLCALDDPWARAEVPD